MRTITLYSKPNCPLCDEALEQIEEARRVMEFEMVEVNILTDPELYERYKHDIPVVAGDGAEWFRHRLTAGELMEKISAVSRRTDPSE